MNLYVFNIEELFKDTIIGQLVNSGTEDLLLQIVHCWCADAFYEGNGFYLWLCNVQALFINIILVLYFTQSNTTRK